ncbi:MAG: hypothetical protein WCJ58_03050 [bacterium]
MLLCNLKDFRGLGSLGENFILESLHSKNVKVRIKAVDLIVRAFLPDFHNQLQLNLQNSKNVREKEEIQTALQILQGGPKIILHKNGTLKAISVTTNKK